MLILEYLNDEIISEPYTTVMLRNYLRQLPNIEAMTTEEFIKLDTRKMLNVRNVGRKTLSYMRDIQQVLINQAKKTKRYFIVFYTANIKHTNNLCHGFIDFTTNGGYLNKKESIEQIIESTKNIDISNVVFTNVIELNEEDKLVWER